ncbi:MAG: asparagine synthase (glutamine-hydrolyzing) [Thermoleophilia bacterium]
MCGIFGFVGAPDRQLLGRMAAALVHRGPDDAGSFERPAVSLGHRRLSIIDRAGSHQPLANEDKSIWLAYNGEIYNYRELRSELEACGHVFRTKGDTEVIVHAYEQWGPSCAARFNGMWAFALADLRPGHNRLILNRDHFGIKPLFYARSPHNGRLLFASEMKGLFQDRDLSAQPDDQMVYEFLQHGLHDHRAETMFRGVYHVPEASWIEVPLDAPQKPGESGLLAAPLPSTRYWSPDLNDSGKPDPAEFRKLFRTSVERRLLSEVPVGSCLSGGLDSTTIVSFMSELLREHAPDAESLRGQLKTFSAVFDGDPIDERDYIEVAVASTGADTTYTNPDSHEFMHELRDFIWHQEEPFVSTGPYAQWCVMRSAREQVTVLLDGQGGDELLAGYVPYQMVYLRQLLRQRRYELLRRESAKSADVLSPLVKRRLGQRRKRLAVRSLLRPSFLDHVADPNGGRSQSDLKLRLMQDLLEFCLPCLLRYEDRNAMAFSVESRVPYLDQELVSFMLSMPDDAIIRDGWSRWILREGLRGTLPEKIRLRRWKVGFTTPEMRWIKARRAAFTSIYQSPAFQARPYWKGDAVGDAFRACCKGKVEESPFFWRAANVELWLREFCDRSIVLEGVDTEAMLTQPAEIGPKHRGEIREAADPHVPALLAASGALGAHQGAAEAERLLRTYEPNALKHLFAATQGRVFARLPIHTDIVRRGDDLAEVVLRHVAPHVRPGDSIAIAENAVSAAQGRSFLIEDIHPTRLATFLGNAVTRTPHGLGLGTPHTMQLAIDQVGAPRIVAAAAIGAAGRVIHQRGLFYRVAGREVEAIDGPTPNRLPPHNISASLGPENPDGVAEELSRVLRNAVGGAVAVSVIDASDLAATILGASPGANRELIATLMRDNPLGQGHEQTPVCIIRPLGQLPISPESSTS